MTINHQPFDEHDGNRVLPDFACPRCGEDRTDYLVWIDDDHVRCTTCQHVYEPGRRGGE